MKQIFTKSIYITLLAMLCAWNLNAQTYNIQVIANPQQGGFVIGNYTSIQYGVAVNVYAYSTYNYVFINWTEDGVEVSTDADYNFVVTGDRILTANFVPTVGQISLFANPVMGGIVCCGGEYDLGTELTVTATPHPFFEFAGWYEDGNMVSAEPFYNFTVEGPRVLAAHFIPATIEITLSKNIEEGGTLGGGGIYSYGQTVLVYATSNLPEYVFMNWTEDGNVVSSDYIYTFNATQSRHLVANFTPATYEIPVYANPNEGGTVTGGGEYTYGTSVTISANANPDYQFLNWTKFVLGEGTVVSTEPNYTYEITGSGWGNCAFVAYFKKDVEITILTNMPEGEVLGGGIYHYGDEVKVEAIPHQGYKFINWTEGRSVLSTDNPYSFTVTEDKVLIANFVEALSIDPIDAGAMMIYPNPTNSEMKVVLNDLTLKIVEMELYDYTGKKVHQQTVNQSSGTLQMNELATGAYILKVYLDQGDVVTWKVVKN